MVGIQALAVALKTFENINYKSAAVPIPPSAPYSDMSCEQGVDMLNSGLKLNRSRLTLKALLVLMALACCMALPTTGLSSSAHTKPGSSAHTTGIKAAHYSNGWFKKKRSGHWGEYNRDGSLRYSFREVCRGKSSVMLRNDGLGVDLLIDTRHRVITAQWPGVARHEMHRITKMTGGPVIGSPSYPPFLPCPFEKTRPGWGGPNTIIDPPGYPVRPPFKPPVHPPVHPPVLPPVSPPVHPPVEPEFPVRPGTMSVADKVRCLAEGGFVERAGFAGFERCTKRYSDGGMICTDSDQCQGSCFADSSSANRSNVTGNCQRTDNPFGCRLEVTNGRTGFAQCAD